MNRLQNSLSSPPPALPLIYKFDPAGAEASTIEEQKRIYATLVSVCEGHPERHHCLAHLSDGSTRTINSSGLTVRELVDHYLGKRFDACPARCIKLEILS